VRVEDARLGKRSLLARHVILAVEPNAAQRLLLESSDTAPAASTITFPSVIASSTARLWFDTQPREGAPGGMFTGDFAIDNFFWLHRLHKEFEAWGEAGGSAIEVHFYAPDSMLDQSNQVLSVVATSEVQRAFPEMRGHFVHAAIRRNGKTQTQFLVPTQHSLWVDTPWENVLACGDWIGCTSPALWMERCVVTGMEAANRVLTANHADPFPILPPREPESLAKAMGAIVRGGRKVFIPIFRTWRQRRHKPVPENI
jgi:hypothetical protein